MKKTLTLLLVLAGLTMAAQGRTLTWDGGDGEWNTTYGNWLDENGHYVLFSNGDDVIFNDRNGTIVLSAALAPHEVRVTNTEGRDYIFTGGGSIVDSPNQQTLLIKDGAGTLTINTANSYSDATLLYNGTLVAGNEKAFGNSYITVYAGKLDMGGYTISNDVTLSYSSSSIVNGTLVGNLTLQKYAPFTWSDDRALQINGSVTLRKESSLNLGGHTLTGPVSITGQQARITNGIIEGDLTLEDGVSFIRTDDDALQINGKVTLGNNTMLNLGGHTLTNTVILTGKNTNIVNGTIAGDLVLAENALFHLIHLDGLQITGNIILGNNATLGLGDHTFANAITLNGNAGIGNGTLNSNLTVKNAKTLTLCGDLRGGGVITLGNNSTLDLGGWAFYNPLRLTGHASSIGNGTLNSNLELGDGTTLTLCGNLNGAGIISLGNNSTLNLGGYALANTVNPNENARIGNGVINGKLTVGANKTLFLCGDIGGSAVMTLEENSTLNLGGHTLTNTVILNESARIGNGTLNGNLMVKSAKTLTLSGNLRGEGNITLGYKATLDLGGCQLYNSVTLDGASSRASIGNGELYGTMTVGSGQWLTLLSDLKGYGTIHSNGTFNLELCDHTFTGTIIVDSKTRTYFLQDGTVNGPVTIGSKAELYVYDNLRGSDYIILRDGAVLTMMNSVTIDKPVLIAENAAIKTWAKQAWDLKNSDMNGNVTVSDGKRFSMLSDLYGSGTVFLGNTSSLDLGGCSLYNPVTLTGNYASINNGNNNGAMHGKITVGDGKTLRLLSDLKGSGTIFQGNNTTLDLGGNTLYLPVSQSGYTHIINGRLNADLNMERGAQVSIENTTVNSGETSIKQSNDSAPGQMRSLNVTGGEIKGLARKTSLMDNLHIESAANLTISATTIIANNKIYAGANTITLQNVTIGITKPDYKLVGSDYIFQLQDLINCKLEMENVLFNATALTLPEGFDPQVNGIGVDFGDDVAIDKATQLTLRMGDVWSQTFRMGAQGQLVFNSFGEAPEIGDISGMTVIINGGTVDEDVFGGSTFTGNATGNTAIGNGAVVAGDVFGGCTENGTAAGNTAAVNGGEVYEVYGGCSFSGDASGNTAILNRGKADGDVNGGCSFSGNASGNTVVMAGGEASGLYGGFSCYGEAFGNTVHLVGEGAAYTTGGTTYQGSRIEVRDSVHGGYVEAGGVSSNNSVHIHGTGISVGGTIDSCQMLNFHIVQGQAGAQGTPMVTLGGALNLDGVELGFYGDAVTDWAAFNGKSITLVSMTNETITGLVPPTDPVDITDEAGKTVATATLTLSDEGKALTLTNIQGVGPVPPPVPTAGPDALDVTLVNSLWASSSYVREFVRLAESQGYALKEGDTAVWGGGFGTFMHATGDRGFKTDGGGYGIGVRHAFSANTQAGISLGQGFGSYHNSGEDGATVHQRAILAAATASTRIGKDLSFGAHLAFGNVRNRADCRLDGAPTERARWNDNVFNLGARAAYDFHVTERTAITPFLGLDWMNGAHESFTGGYGRYYTHGRLNELRMPVGVTVSTSAEVGSTKLLPQLSVAYVPSLAQQLPHADVSGENGNYRVKGYAPGRNAFMLNVGVNAVFSDSWSAGAFYTLETRRHCVDQSVNASVRYTF